MAGNAMDAFFDQLSKVRMARRYLVVLIAVLGLYAPILESKELSVLTFSFEVPEHWLIHGNGQRQVMATGGRDGSKLPFLAASGCVPSAQRACVAPPLRRSAPPPGLPNEGCAQALAQPIARNDRIDETRWICPHPIASGALTAQSGLSHFAVDGSFLTVWYVVDAQDGDVATILEEVSRSLKRRQ
jgi:hypothetical protein